MRPRGWSVPLTRPSRPANRLGGVGIRVAPEPLHGSHAPPKRDGNSAEAAHSRTEEDGREGDDAIRRSVAALPTARSHVQGASCATTIMPFKSQAQRRKFAQLLVERKISAKTYEEWNRETGRKKLPERVKRQTKASKKRPMRRRA